MAVLSQFGLLLWKNLLIQRRSPVFTVFEALLPVAYMMLMVWFRQEVTDEWVETTNYSSFDVSGSLMDFIEPIPYKNKTITMAGPTFSPTILYYAPENEFTRGIMEIAVKAFNSSNFPQNPTNMSFAFDLYGFENEDAMVKNITKEFEQATSCNNPYVGAIVFNFTSKTDTKFKYKIRLPAVLRGNVNGGQWNTNQNFPARKTPGPRSRKDPTGGTPGYFWEGFLTLQRALDAAITSAVLPDDSPVKAATLVPVKMKRYPYPEYRSDIFAQAFGQNLPSALIIGYVVSVIYCARAIVQEKESRLKEYMKVMGLSGWLHWVAHFITNFVKTAIVAGLLTLIMCVPIAGKAILTYSDPSVIFFFLLVYAAATVWFAFTVSVFFQSGNAAAGVAFIAWFFSQTPYNFLQPRYDDLSYVTKMVSSLSMNVAMSFASGIIGNKELSGAGLQWSNIAEPANPEDDITMLHMIIMILIDILICIILTWYVEAVYPGEGVPQKPWFPFMPSYWCPGCGNQQEADDYYFPQEEVPAISGHEKIEKDPAGLKAQINIKGLGKVFGSGAKRLVAVNNLNMKMFPGQVTALLGHNGAGKSTTMSMLTGILPPSSGHAFINGYDIRTALPNVRKYLGLCPQFNVLFENLTVKEHLKFFCKLKGRKFEKSECRRLLDMLGLTEKKKELAKSLSGGMKRKLSVAVALIGGSEVVMLDEPTSGMDPNARHEAWRLLQAEKSQRTILLTTHYMEEADLLGDRIAILARGKLQCCGSSLFLKKHYGAGYHITVVFDERTQVNNRKRPDKVLDLLRRHCPDVEEQSVVGLEATFQLPQSYRSQFENLFLDLEKNQQRLGISSFGVSVTTMEEVFLKVGEIADEEAETASQENVLGISTANIVDDSSSTDSGVSLKGRNGEIHLNKFNSANDKSVNYTDLKQPKRNKGIARWCQQLKAMFLNKRAVYALRTWYMLLVSTLVPLIFVALGLLAAKMIPGATEQQPMILNLDRFDETYVTFIQNRTNAEEMKFISDYTASLSSKANFTPIANESIDEYMMSQYGDLDERYVNQHFIVGAGVALSDDLKQHRFEAYFQNEAFHSPAISLSLMGNALLRMFTGRNISIETTNHPLPPTGADQIEESAQAQAKPIFISFNLLFGIAFTASTFVTFLVRERQTKMKHMQFLAGVMPTAYWLGHFLWDFLTFMISLLLLIAVFAAFDTTTLVGDGRWPLLILLEVDYAWGMIPMMYAFSFLFSTPTKAYVLTCIFNVLSGLAPFIANMILSMLPDLENIQKILIWVFMALFPNFCLGQGVTDLMTNENFKETCDPVKHLCTQNISLNNLKNDSCDFSLLGLCCNSDFYQENSLDWNSPGIGRELAFLCAHGVVYWLIVFAIEMDLLRPLRRLCMGFKSGKNKVYPYQQQMIEDADVLNEREKVHRITPRDATVLVKDITKYYGFLKAVDKVNFSVMKEECFGLLGVNGAGKTSTFQMLTGENLISDGDAVIGGQSVQRSWRKACHYIGYCPQFDAIIEELTGNEALSMMARLLGIPEGKIKKATNAVVKAIGIERYQDRQIRTYSGGNKRRLSLGIALVGLPDVLLLDEPTTGVDPAARRAIWNILATVREHGTSLVLTSHSMEECEALCTRIAIMVAGGFRCLGSPQHLKSKFGAGYSLQIKVEDPNMVQEAMETIARVFPGSKIKEVHYTLMIYELARNENVTWSQLFHTLEQLVVPLKMVDYSLSQTTLEQVFLQFSKGY